LEHAHLPVARLVDQQLHQPQPVQARMVPAVDLMVIHADLVAVLSMDIVVQPATTVELVANLLSVLAHKITVYSVLYGKCE
jgi:hypothetical protein